jgi:hypothetical protein
LAQKRWNAALRLQLFLIDLSLFFAYYDPEVDLFLKQDGGSVKCQKKTYPNVRIALVATTANKVTSFLQTRCDNN